VVLFQKPKMTKSLIWSRIFDSVTMTDHGSRITHHPSIIHHPSPLDSVSFSKSWTSYAFQNKKKKKKKKVKQNLFSEPHAYNNWFNPYIYIHPSIHPHTQTTQSVSRIDIQSTETHIHHRNLSIDTDRHLRISRVLSGYDYEIKTCRHTFTDLQSFP